MEIVGVCGLNGEDVTQDTECKYGWEKGQKCCCSDNCEEFEET